MTDPHLANRLKTLRTALGLTQKQLANHIGVASSTLARVETNKHNPHAAYALRIQNALNDFEQRDPQVHDATEPQDQDPTNQSDLDTFFACAQLLDALTPPHRHRILATLFTYYGDPTTPGTHPMTDNPKGPHDAPQ